MKAVAQRVTSARVTVDDREVGAIQSGLAVLVGVSDTDTEADATALADKLVGLRVFADEQGKMNRSIVESAGSMLVVSQFTLIADVRKGRRPSFVHAAHPSLADSLVQAVATAVAEHGVPVETGEFGAYMAVELINDGPVTIVIETEDGRVR